MFPALNLPATASTDQVVSRVFDMISFDAGRVDDYQILEARRVQITGTLPDEYTAAVVDTHLGRKIVLMQFQPSGNGGMWWSRVYDAELREP